MDETPDDSVSSLDTERQPKLHASCRTCAEWKVRCSKDQPTCACCMSNGLPCTYNYSTEHVEFSLTNLGTLFEPSSAVVGGPGELLHPSEHGRLPKLRASCDACAASKVKCGKERPICAPCFANGSECIYGHSSRLVKPSRTRERYQDGTSLLEAYKFSSNSKPPPITTTWDPDDMVLVGDTRFMPQGSLESTAPPHAKPPALGYHTFTWRYPGKEVFITGSFDGWSKSVQLDRRGDVFEKGVNLPKARTTYKFVVDGEWVLDPKAPTEAYGLGVYDNVLLAEEIVDDRWAEIKRNAAQRTALSQAEIRESGEDSIEERVARIKVRVEELTRPVSRPQLEEATSKNPKLDRILSLLNDDSTRKAFEAHEISDLWIPIPKQAVKRLLADEHKTRRFLRAQDGVLDSSFQLFIDASGLSASASRHASVDDDEGLINELRVLGEGAYGIVEEVRVAGTTDTRTMTCVRKRIGRPRQLKALKHIMTAFVREVSVMRQVDHQHCVRFIGSYTDVDHISILSSPVADMDLATFLDLPIHDRERDVLYRGLGCLCDAINYLHKNNIRHEDLKPQNVLIHGDNILLTDFGFSLDFSDDSMSTTTGRPSAWTVRYSAPEVLSFEPRNRASDIWSLGCILFEMVSAFNGTSLSELKEQWKRNSRGNSSYADNSAQIDAWFIAAVDKFSVATETVRHFCMFVGFMLNTDPICRPSAQQIVDRIFDISLLVSDPTKWTNAQCYASGSCGGLSGHTTVTGVDPGLEAIGDIPELAEYLFPYVCQGWHWGLWDLQWNAISIDGTYSTEDERLPHPFQLDFALLEASVENLYKKVNRTGNTKPYWDAHDEKNTEILLRDAQIHASCSAGLLSVKNVVCRRLWLRHHLTSSIQWKYVQVTLLPICLRKSSNYGNFFCMLSWPEEQHVNAPSENSTLSKIWDFTTLYWPHDNDGP